MPLLNFTSRTDIDRNLVEIAVNESSATLVVYLKTKEAFRLAPAYAGGSVVFEAYKGMKAQRVELATIDHLTPSVEVHFNEFSSTEKPSFRLKVVRADNKMILGIVDGLRQNDEPKIEEPGNLKPLLPVNWANESDNMENRFWKVGFSGTHPILLLRRGKFSALGEVNQPAFQALAFPQVLTEILTQAFVVNFANPPSWSEDWETMVDLLGVEPRPILDLSANGDKLSGSVIQEHLDATREWIDQVAEKFASSQKLLGINSQFKRS